MRGMTVLALALSMGCMRAEPGPEVPAVDPSTLSVELHQLLSGSESIAAMAHRGRNDHLDLDVRLGARWIHGGFALKTREATEALRARIIDDEVGLPVTLDLSQAQFFAREGSGIATVAAPTAADILAGVLTREGICGSTLVKARGVRIFAEGVGELPDVLGMGLDIIDVPAGAALGTGASGAVEADGKCPYFGDGWNSCLPSTTCTRVLGQPGNCADVFFVCYCS